MWTLAFPLPSLRLLNQSSGCYVAVFMNGRFSTGKRKETNSKSTRFVGIIVHYRPRLKYVKKRECDPGYH